MRTIEHLTQGELFQVTFGSTFVTLEGATMEESGVVRWWLRLGKRFDVNSSSAPAATIIDPENKEFSGASELLGCIGNNISSHSIDLGGIKLEFSNGVFIEMSWHGQISCAQLDVERQVEGVESELIAALTFPDDLAEA